MNKSLLLLVILFSASCHRNEVSPRVFVFTDINIDAGDPDDRQSLVHLLWYANELQIEGIVPDRWNASGYKACELAIEAYTKDYHTYSFNKRGYPEPTSIQSKIAKDTAEAIRLFAEAAADSHSPLYVLVWGNMEVFKTALTYNPALAKNIRLITIGTHLMLEKDIKHMPADWEKADRPCEQYNWNGFGRNEIFYDQRFTDMWWLEINWTYAGMFSGEEPGKMFDKLAVFGNLGQHMKEVVKNESWAQYFRVGDTPSVLYVIDPNHNADDPTQSSWAGRFVQPFPEERPQYYTDYHGPIDWDYAEPCKTWHNHQQGQLFAKSTLENRRDEMYQALLEKLRLIYDKP